MDGIFISYRRDDSAGYAGRLYDRLSAHLGAERVFMDVEGIELGTDFVTAIEKAVGSCKVLIVVIGDEWLSTTDPAGRRRLDDPHDFVRLETRVALEREIRVVPVLVGGALMPRADELPEELKSLARRQAIEISHKQWDASTRELIRALNIMLGQRADTGITVPGDLPDVQREPPALASMPLPASSAGSSARRGGWLLGAGAGAVVLGAAVWVGLRSQEPARQLSSTPMLTAATIPPSEAPVVVAAAPVRAPASAASRPAAQVGAVRERPAEAAPALVAAAPARTPDVVSPVNAALPRPGESWTYRTSGKWPTSPRRDIVISVQSVRDGLVTDALRADAEARVVGDSRRAMGGRPGFLKWDQLGLEYSPYLGAFRDLSSLGALSDFATPDVDTWGQWHSQAKVLGLETVNVPGGKFEAFKVEVWSSRSATGGATQAAIEPVRIHYLVWYAPQVKRYVKMQRRVISAANREIEKDVFELVAHR